MSFLCAIRARSGAGTSGRRLHVTREAFGRYDLPTATFGLYGRLLQLDQPAAFLWSARVNARRSLQASGSGQQRHVSPGEMLAAVALHELMHALIAAFTAPGAPYAGAMQSAARRLQASFGAGAVGQLSQAFSAAYVPASLDSRTAGPAPDAAVLVEELLLLDLARRNGALRTLDDLFVAPAFMAAGPFERAVALVQAELGGSPSAPMRQGTGLQAEPDGQAVQLGRLHEADESSPLAAPQSLLALLLVPQRQRPDSLADQLALALELWSPYLAGRYGQALEQAKRAADVLREEYAPPAAPGGAPEPQLRGPYEPLSDDEVQAFSSDSSWMPGVVLVAKSTYVWLAQLSRRFGYEVRTLDAVPDEALAELAEQGFNALWLIGVWWRSEASKTIKRLRGQPDALASAYSVRDYVVAPELGGDEAMARLRDRAARHGLRLASDMVPNHTAIDARWVIEHPDWFVQTPEPPYPGYTFNGPDLSPDPRAALRIEDHYYDGSDAAVVFQRVDSATGEARYLYHGNDGTALPWNDTAQLDFLQPEVRRAVIGTTIEVARRFPLIRLDAAMTLARRHVRRLWHPQPGEGGAVPSRSMLAESAYEFDRRMPQEFWRELVDALAVEAPGTMLMAEAFWLMEVYFVRTLGMHRVYNSAFMHMTLKEQNAEYRRYLKRYLAEAPEVLGRFVNYMSNPDEEPVAAQFGDGDKAFGVTTLLATLPGLPMFGHGQVEGLAEKYGMEFAAPRLAEHPRDWHVARHMSQIAPLLKSRHLFAGSELFRLFDLVTDDDSVAEDVYVYTNGLDGRRILVAYNNSPSFVAGSVRLSCTFALPGGGERRESLTEALALGQLAAGEVVFARPDGSELRVHAAELGQRGLRLELGPYEAAVFMDVRQTQPPAPEPAVTVARKRRQPRSLALLARPRDGGRKRRVARRRR